MFELGQFLKVLGLLCLQLLLVLAKFASILFDCFLHLLKVVLHEAVLLVEVLDLLLADSVVQLFLEILDALDEAFVGFGEGVDDLLQF